MMETIVRRDACYQVLVDVIFVQCWVIIYLDYVRMDGIGWEGIGWAGMGLCWGCKLGDASELEVGMRKAMIYTFLW